MFLPLPESLILKIIFYAHPILKKTLQKDIINYKFINKNKKFIYCNYCSRNHKFPRHFSCNFSL